MRVLSITIRLMALLSVFCLSLGYRGSVGAQSITQNQHIYLPIIRNQVPGNLNGYVYQAGNSGQRPIANATICFPQICTTSDAAGHYQFLNVSSDVATVSATDYETAQVFLPVASGTMTRQDIVMSRKLIGTNILMRIIVTWDNAPSYGGLPNDMNAHLWMSKPEPPNNPHIFWDNPGLCVGFPNTCLTQEVSSGFGPETIEITDFFTETYYFGVKNEYQGEPGVPSINRLGVQVQVYDINGLVKTFSVPTTGSGDFWYVFSFTGDENKNSVTLQPRNCLTYMSNDENNPFPSCP